MHGSDSQSQPNKTASLCLFNSMWRHLWISVVSLRQTSFHTHSAVSETPPGKVTFVPVDYFWKGSDQSGRVRKILISSLLDITQKWRQTKRRKVPSVESMVWAQAILNVKTESVGFVGAVPKHTTTKLIVESHSQDVKYWHFGLVKHPEHSQKGKRN